MPEVTHEHSWTLSNIFPEDEKSYSPVTRMDDQIRTNQWAVQSCPCGTMRPVLVSYGTWRWLNR